MQHAIDETYCNCSIWCCSPCLLLITCLENSLKCSCLTLLSICTCDCFKTTESSTTPEELI